MNEVIIGFARDIVDGSSQITTWSLSLIGGSVAALLAVIGKSLENHKFRIPYLLLIPGWFFIGASMYFGDYLTRSYTSLTSYVGTGDAEFVRTILVNINGIYDDQRLCFFVSLCCFALWLMIMLVQWVVAGGSGEEISR